MEKAYDFKELGKRIVARGLPSLKEVGEEEAKVIYEELKKWFQESAVISPNKIDDAVAPFIGLADQVVLPQIDKIDGKIGE